ncbi:MAG: hypothetical protein Q7S31_00770 [bacterium]|nr:hypothetical protein [bacterium]
MAEEEFSSSPSPIIPSEVTKSARKPIDPTVWIILGAIILAILGGLAFWFGSRDQSAVPSLPTPTPSLTVLVSPEPSPSPSVSPSPSPKVSPKPTPKPSPSPVASPSPSPLPSTSPTPTPTPAAVSVSPPTVTPPSSNSCTQTFTFQASITVNAAMTITYKWERSDPSSSDPISLTFAGPGTQNVSTTWQSGPLASGASNNGWERVHVLTPSDVTSSQANFTQTCP